MSLRSEHIRLRLFWAMLVIIFCILIICIPLIFNSGYRYFDSLKTYEQIEALQDVADLANRISRERGPANKLMSSTPATMREYRMELASHRAIVDAQMQKAKQQLYDSGFTVLSTHIEQVLQPSLEKGRQKVDAYVALPIHQRSAAQLDQSILAMFQVWEDCRHILKDVVMASEIESTKINRFVSQILLLADLRDQAGRVVSNVTAAVTFATPMPEANLTRTLQTHYQVHYLWDLIDTLQPEEDKTAEFLHLHGKIETYFLKEGLPIVMRLLEDDAQQRPYHLTGLELTEVMGDKFATVVDLQRYLLEYSHEMAHQEMHRSLNRLLMMLIICLVSFGTAIFTLFYARSRIFIPLMQARDLLLDLIEPNPQTESDQAPRRPVSDTLFDAIQKLQHMLQQREALEFRLKNIAHSDSLTGLSNRFALNEYIKFKEQQPHQFHDVCLMVIDIDHFKQVNDQYGHIVGDRVIQAVAQCLKTHVRPSDLLVRYGGDEFLVFIEHMPLDQALYTAEKIRQAVADAQVTANDGQVVAVSVSIGVAVGAESWMQLLDKADQALFRSKEKGRNVVSS